MCKFWRVYGLCLKNQIIYAFLNKKYNIYFMYSTINFALKQKHLFKLISNKKKIVFCFYIFVILRLTILWITSYSFI